MYTYFRVFFQLLEIIEENKNYYNEKKRKKKIGCRNLEGLRPKLYCRRMEIVLQYSGLEDCWKCIAIQLVYCNLWCTVARFCIAIEWFVLQEA